MPKNKKKQQLMKMHVRHAFHAHITNEKGKNANYYCISGLVFICVCSSIGESENEPSAGKDLQGKKWPKSIYYALKL